MEKIYRKSLKQIIDLSFTLKLMENIFIVPCTTTNMYMRADLTCSDLNVHRKTWSVFCDPQIRPSSLRANIGTRDHWFSHRSRNPDRFHVRNITDKTESYQNPEIDRAGDDEISFQSDISIWTRYV